MNNLLNRALNFAVLPLQLDITEVLVDFNRFLELLFGKNIVMGVR